MRDVRSSVGIPTVEDFRSSGGSPIVIDISTSRAYVLDANNDVTEIPGSSIGGASWGGITGTLSAQTDLQSALDAKGTSNFDGVYSSLSGIPSSFTPSAHTQAASTISDSTAVGQSVMTAVDAAAARTAIGAGTSSFDGAYGSLSGKPTAKRTVGMTFDGGGSPPTAGSVGYLVCEFTGVIDQWAIVADAAGSAVVDVWKAAGSIPTNSNSIAGTEKPTLSAQQLNSDTNLTTWTTAVTAGDVFAFELESVATCTRLTCEVRIAETL